MGSGFEFIKNHLPELALAGGAAALTGGAAAPLLGEAAATAGAAAPEALSATDFLAGLGPQVLGDAYMPGMAGTQSMGLLSHLPSAAGSMFSPTMASLPEDLQMSMLDRLMAAGGKVTPMDALKLNGLLGNFNQQQPTGGGGGGQRPQQTHAQFNGPGGDPRQRRRMGMSDYLGGF